MDILDDLVQQTDVFGENLSKKCTRYGLPYTKFIYYLNDNVDLADQYRATQLIHDKRKRDFINRLITELESSSSSKASSVSRKISNGEKISSVTLFSAINRYPDLKKRYDNVVEKRKLKRQRPTPPLTQGSSVAISPTISSV